MHWLGLSLSYCFCGVFLFCFVLFAFLCLTPLYTHSLSGVKRHKKENMEKKTDLWFLFLNSAVCFLDIAHQGLSWNFLLEFCEPCCNEFLNDRFCLLALSPAVICSHGNAQKVEKNLTCFSLSTEKDTCCHAQKEIAGLWTFTFAVSNGVMCKHFCWVLKIFYLVIFLQVAKPKQCVLHIFPFK